MKLSPASRYFRLWKSLTALSLLASMVTFTPSASADGLAPTPSASATPTSAYTVSYDGNGNTGGTAPIVSAAYGSGATVIVAGQGTLVRSGYTFGGWGGAGAGSSHVFQPGQSFAISGSTIFTAIWTANTFTITYDGNGNTGGSAPLPTAGLGGTILNLATNSGGLANSGFIFDSWNTQANGSGTYYAQGASFTLISDLTLHARWVPNRKPYKIIYDGNTNSGGSAPNPTVGSGLVYLANNTGGLVKTGFAFVGWNTYAGGTGISYSTGAAYSLNANITLHANWIRRIANIYTITYLGNHATGGHVPSPTVGSGSVTLRNNSGLLVKTGFAFVGWNTQANGLGTTHAITSPYTLAANLTLYAEWNRITFLITYLGNGNTAGNVPTSYVGSGSVTLANRGNLILLTTWNWACLSGCSNATLSLNFTGWNTQANNWLLPLPGLGTHYGAGSTFNLNANVTLYAEWNMNYTITYHGNGNTSGSGPSPTLFNSSSPLGVAANTGLLAKSGFTFGGWNTQADGLGIDRAVGSTNYPVADFTLYAKWNAISCALGGACVIGDTGPGGGTVFYSSQSAFTSVGSACNTHCHYVEAAPNTWSGGSADPSKGWALNTYAGTSVAGTSAAIGTGLVNSTRILAQGNSAATAAGAARAYMGGNKQDWYLPSIDELNAMYLHKSILSGFVSNGNYWSSSEFDASSAWYEGFDYGNPFNFAKTFSFYLRPTRAF